MTASEERKEYCRQWRKKNRAKVNAMRREYRLKNKAKIMAIDHAPHRKEARRMYRLKMAGHPKTRFFEYGYGAKLREIAFTLTFDEFMLFWKKPCHYCSADIGGIGLDRVDNTQGYVIGNIVPCCKVCNRGKSNLSQHEFFAWVARVASKHLTQEAA